MGHNLFKIQNGRLAHDGLSWFYELESGIKCRLSCDHRFDVENRTVKSRPMRLEELTAPVEAICTIFLKDSIEIKFLITHN